MGRARLSNQGPVRPAFQGRGVGRSLLTHAIGVAREEGPGQLRICTGNSSIGPLALYQKVGFRIVGVDRDYFSKYHTEPIFANGIQCRDRIVLAYELGPAAIDR